VVSCLCIYIYICVCCSVLTRVCDIYIYILRLFAEGQLVVNEEFEGLTSEDLSSAENWTHQFPAVRKQGRCAQWTPPAPEGEEGGEGEYIYIYLCVCVCVCVCVADTTCC